VRPVEASTVAAVEESESMMVSFIGNIKQEPEEEGAGPGEVEEEMEKLFSGLYPQDQLNQDVPDQILSSVETDSDTSGSESGEVTFNVKSLKQRIEQLKYKDNGTQQDLNIQQQTLIVDWSDC